VLEEADAPSGQHFLRIGDAAWIAAKDARHPTLADPPPEVDASAGERWIDVELDSQTLFDQCWALCTILRPAYERLGELQRTRPLLHVDETPWPLYTSKGQTAAASKWHIWTLVSEIGVYNEIHGGRGLKAGASLLGDYDGYVMCDGYAVYEALAKRYPALRMVQCWSHARRKFVDCESAFPVECSQILDLLGELYAIEDKAGDDLEERRRLRQSESRQGLTKIQQWAVEVRCVPGSALDDAIRTRGPIARARTHRRAVRGASRRAGEPQNGGRARNR